MEENIWKSTATVLYPFVYRNVASTLNHRLETWSDDAKKRTDVK